MKQIFVFAFWLSEARPTSWSETRRIIDALRERVKELPLPPQRLIDAIGGGDGDAIGQEVLRQLLVLTDLHPGARVLEPGCGFGRNARWLSTYLNSSGSFDGFDIVPELVKWGQHHITPAHPNVRLQVAHIVKSHYMTWLKVPPVASAVPAESLRWPYADQSFDLTFNPSVFTHVTFRVLENYLREAYRTLRPGGQALFWFFVLDDDAKTSLSTRLDSFPEGMRMTRFDEVSYALQAAPEAAIAFNESYLRRTLEATGFMHRVTIKGGWRAPGASPSAAQPAALRGPSWEVVGPNYVRPVPPSFQDIILVRRPQSR